MKKYFCFFVISLFVFLSVFGQVSDSVPEPTLEQKVDWLYTFFSQFKESMCAVILQPEVKDPEGDIKAIISGDLGTPENRISTGRTVTFDSFNSICGGGGGLGFVSNWALGEHSGGVYFTGFGPIVGSEGSIASWRVPPMSAPIEQEIILTIVCGDTEVNTKVIAYLSPVISGFGNIE